MNYKCIYDKIIFNRIKYPILDESYTENHHIIPQSLGGTDEQNNLVKLSAREHFICHYLLAKIYLKYSFEWYKMNNAFMMMKVNTLNHNRYFNSRLYESLKKNFSEVMSINQTGNKNSQFGTMWITCFDSLEKKKVLKSDSIPTGWVKGRLSNKITCKVCKKVFLSSTERLTCSKDCFKECLSIHSKSRTEESWKNPHPKKPFIDENGNRYESISDCALKLNIVKGLVSYRIKIGLYKRI